MTRTHVEVHGNAGPIHPLRVIISSSFMYQLQVTSPIIRTSKFGMLHGSEDVDSILDELLPGSNMAVCPGIADYQTRYSSIRHKPKGLTYCGCGRSSIAI